MLMVKKKSKSKKAKNVVKKVNLLEDPGKLLTPNWFWTRYINKQIVPPPVARPLVEVADPQMGSPLSNSSKLHMMDSSGFLAASSISGIKTPCPPPPILIPNEMNPDFEDILTISRQRLLRNMGNTFDIEKILPKKKKNKKKKKGHLKPALIEIVEQKPEVPDPIPPVLDSMLTDAVTAHDFELIWRTDSANPNISFAQALQQKANRKLANYEIIWEAIKNYLHDDLEIQIESKFYHVDRFLFTHFARNFRGCSGSFLQIPVQKVQMSLMIHIYNWMLGEAKGFPIGNDLIPFIMAAKFLGVRKLVQQYWNAFSPGGRSGVWELNAFHTYLVAREFRCPDTMALMMSRVRKCFLPLVASREFLEFDANEVACLLRQDMLCVNTEDEVFFACLYWVDFAWAERKKHAVHLLAKIRFALLSPSLRRSLCNFPETAHIGEIARLPQVVDWLWEGNQYCQAMLVNGQPSRQKGKAVQKLLEKYKQNKIPERYWTYCRGMPHHHDMRCPRHRELTFESFKRILHRLQSHSQKFMDGLRFVPNKYWYSYRCCVDVQFRPHCKRTCPKPPIYRKALRWDQRLPRE
ncbi:uncharacterized protein LOC108039357 [Drosophila rhopaloa]|uniref:Uncharacterized protein LOC108039357 n=1 Tax=Drosophila rhopaloa TaxID=1041015 RepID=A0A6P4E1Q1_DRORH|nr:uncharacterized protein LOC108039357 [Drosophila rhopaloa]